MMRRSRGFTIVEVLVSLAIFAIIAAGLFYLLIRNQRSARITGNLVEAQQNARVAIDVLARDIRVAGYGADIQNEQPAVQYAGPFEIMFNANMVPYPDTTDPRGDPQAVHWDATNLPPHSRRTPAINDTTGAETVVYTLDYNNDGAINTQDIFGATGNLQSKDTYNPNDMMLMRHIYAWEQASNQNTITSEEVALIRGPLPAAEVHEPLFQYWLDTDLDGVADSLYGDSDNSGDLDDSEISSLTPLQWPIDAMDLRRIARVTLTAIGEMPERDRRYKINNGYRQVRITSDVAIGSNVVLPATVVQRLIKGHIYRDCYENQTGTDPVDNWRVQLGTALYDITDANGEFEFVVAPGTYNLWIHNILHDHYGWYVTTNHPVDTLKQNIDVTDGDTSDVDWYVNSPFGTLEGFVFHDTNLDTVYNLGSDSAFTDSSYVGFDIVVWGPRYDTTGSPPNIDTVMKSVYIPESTYVIGANEKFLMQDSTYQIKVAYMDTIGDFGTYWDSLAITMPPVCDFFDTLNIPLARVSPPPECSLKTPAFIRGGELKTVEWYMWDYDDPPESLVSTIQYSLDGGLHWHIAKYKLQGPDTSMLWFVPPSATDKLYLRLEVDDPDTNNQPCVSIRGPLDINYPFMMFPSGLFIIRDRVIAEADTLDPAWGSPMAKVIQMIPRQIRIGVDSLEEDTAKAVMPPGPDTVDFIVYWQQDTVDVEAETGDTFEIYADSAIWVSEYQDPLQDSMPAGPWRFFLWGNYYPVDDETLDCDITLQAEIYCISEDGSGVNDTLLFFTDATPSARLLKLPKIDFLEVHYNHEIITDCERLKLKVKAVRFDSEPTDVEVYFYYNGPSSSYFLSPRVPVE